MMAVLLLNILTASAASAISGYGIYSAVEEANPYWYSYFVVGSFLLFDRPGQVGELSVQGPATAPAACQVDSPAGLLHR